MKLEVKHLAPYLPYGLKLQITNGLLISNRAFELDCGHDFHNLLATGCVKPILRPLTDLEKDDDVAYQATFLHKICLELGLLKDNNYIFQYNFLDIEKTYRIITPYQDVVISIPKNTDDIGLVRKYIFDKLVSYHFDVFGLIEKGLAININTLNNSENADNF